MIINEKNPLQMKTIMSFFTAITLMISSSAFAGNLDTCCSTELQSLNMMAASESSEAGALSDSGVRHLLQGMTHEVRERVNAGGVESILQLMTKQVRERIANTNDGGSL